MRIGTGWDSHAFQPGVPLRIGGVEIDHPRGLAGHSDGDVLLHAITDALLGAVAAGDIGSFFPSGDPRWKGADSAIFLRTALDEVRRAGYRIANVDTTLILAAPKIAPLARQMREKVAALLHVDVRDVGIKAKTPEGLRQDEVAVAQAAVLLEAFGEEDDLSETAASEEEPGRQNEAQSQVDDVVRKLVDASEADPVHGTGTAAEPQRGGASGSGSSSGAPQEKDRQGATLSKPDSSQ